MKVCFLNWQDLEWESGAGLPNDAGTLSLHLLCRQIENLLEEKYPSITFDYFSHHRFEGFEEKKYDFIFFFSGSFGTNVDFSLNYFPEKTKYILISTEPLMVHGNLDKIIPFSHDFDYIFDYQEENISIFEKNLKGKVFKIFPMYHPANEIFFWKNRNSWDKNKTIDVLHYGHIYNHPTEKTPRREKIIEALQTEGLKVHHVERFNSIEEQNEYLSKSKILISINFYEDNKPIDFYRISYPLSNKVFLIQEAPNKKNEDEKLLSNIITCPYENMVSTCKTWLNAGQESREYQADKCYNFFRKEYDIRKHFPIDIF